MEGRKEDNGKAPVDLVPTEWITGLSRICGYGKTKYGADNWRKGFLWSRLYAAALRHLMKFWDGEDIDESGQHHMLHAAWNCLALYWYSLRRKKEEDDRPKFGK
jgi:hypothetical protein